MAKNKTAAKRSAKKPVAKKAAAKKVSARKPVAEAASRKVSPYTPKPVEGIGWAPFRYTLPLV